MVNKPKTVGVMLLLALVLAVAMVLPAMADGNETILPVVAEENKTALTVLAAGEMDVWDPEANETEDVLEESESGFTGFPYSVLFLGTRYEVWRSYDSNIVPAEGTTITPGLMPVSVGEGDINWGRAEEVTPSTYFGEHYYAYSPPPEALGKEYTIKFVAEYRNADGLVYRQDESLESSVFTVTTSSMPTDTGVPT